MRPRKEEPPGWFPSDQLASRVREAGAPHPAGSGNLQTGTGAVNLEGPRVRQKSGPGPGDWGGGGAPDSRQNQEVRGSPCPLATVEGGGRQICWSNSKGRGVLLGRESAGQAPVTTVHCSQPLQLPKGCLFAYPFSGCSPRTHASEYFPIRMSCRFSVWVFLISGRLHFFFFL